MIQEHRFLQFYSMDAPEDLAVRVHYVKGLDVTIHAIESPCLVTELLLRGLGLDSKILLQSPVNTV